MSKNQDGRKLGRTVSGRTALLRNLASALFLREKIRTTESKAKELRRFAEILITKAKVDTLSSRRLVGRDIREKKVFEKLFKEIAPRYRERKGGYTRILKIGYRRGDATCEAQIELV